MGATSSEVYHHSGKGLHEDYGRESTDSLLPLYGTQTWWVFCIPAGVSPAASSSFLLKRRLSEGFQGRAQGAVCAWNLDRQLIIYFLACLFNSLTWNSLYQLKTWHVTLLGACCRHHVKSYQPIFSAKKHLLNCRLEHDLAINSNHAP